ncbi:MAG: 30S ribosome-binding factor RbfA [Terrimicrobiaceae bacterium]|nr:30S ribosome-binding factor RbfA [Terrimicrobiaceae bacterium]
MKYRLKRVCEVLKRELGLIIVRELRFSSPLVTVSDVDITPDLKQAHVFVSVIGNDAQGRDAIEQLQKNRAMLQHELSRRVTLKHTPHLNFKLDESLERGTRVISLMDELGLIPRTPGDEPGEPDDERHV